MEAQLRIEPAVHEEHVAHPGDGVVLAQPATVHASGSEGIAPLEESRWMLGHPLLAGSVVKRLAVPGAPRVRHKFSVILPSLLPQLFRPIGRERPIVFKRDVSEVARHGHDFVVAKQGAHFAVLFLSLGLEAHKQVKGSARAGTPVRDVARLHQHGRAPGPLDLLVDEARALEDGDKFRKSAVHVADRHHARRSSARALGSRPSGDSRTHEQETNSASPAKRGSEFCAHRVRSASLRGRIVNLICPSLDFNSIRRTVPCWLTDGGG